MDFTQVSLKLDSNFIEIIIAELSETGYDSFWEEEEGVLAYIEREKFDEKTLKSLQEKYWEARITYEFSGLESKNWNEEWEKNFQPIVIANKCHVRATFHEPRPELDMEVVIDPKMSFGTGHHATTSMMVEYMLEMDFSHKKVLDVGCGSAILSIVAQKLGAESVFAFDIDDWAVENSKENIKLNNCSNIFLEKGTITTISLSYNYDVILANITRNVLLDEIPHYAKLLEKGGVLLLSGFYESDIDRLVDTANMYKLSLQNTKLKEGGWAALLLEKV
jgi:ribosomal protein L11 methyltransferase